MVMRSIHKKLGTESARVRSIDRFAFHSPPKRRRRNLCCMRQTESRRNPTLGVSSSFVTEFFEQAHAVSCRRRSPKCALLGPNVDD